MGFLSDLFGTNSDRRLLDAVDADSTDVLSKNYRRNGLENTESHYGWYTCPKCGKNFRQKQMDADHIVPKSMGGDNTRDNIQMLCYHCNRSKNNRMDDTYEDLRRRREELQQQHRESKEMLRKMRS